MNHYCYKIIVNEGPLKNHWYIGKRTCYVPIELDPYMGSGSIISKLTSEFDCTKIIIEVLPTSDAAYELESKLVTTEELKDPLCLNLKTGGGRDKHSDKVIKYADAWSTIVYKKLGYLTRRHEIIAVQFSLNPDLVNDGSVSDKEFRAVIAACRAHDKLVYRYTLIWTKPDYLINPIIRENKVYKKQQHAKSKTQINHKNSTNSEQSPKVPKQQKPKMVTTKFGKETYEDYIKRLSGRYK